MTLKRQLFICDVKFCFTPNICMRVYFLEKLCAAVRTHSRNVITMKINLLLFLVFLLPISLVYTTTNSTSDKTATKSITNCTQQFRPSIKSHKQGWLFIDLENPTAKDATYNHFLACPTLDVIKYADEDLVVQAGKTRQAGFLLQISLKHYNKHPEQSEHACTFSKWTKESGAKKTPQKCKLEILTVPTNGLFSKPCDKKSKDSIELSLLQNGHSITITHSGSTTSYLANIACDPDINLVHHGNIYNTLKDGGKWVIPLFPNCSRVLDLDYSGVCKISVYHLCQGKTFVTEHTFVYNEGDVPECTYEKVAAIKSLFVNLWFTGPNQVLSFMTISLLSIVILSLLAKMAILFSKHDTEYGWALFVEELKSVFWFCACCCQKCCKKENYKLMI